MAESWADLGKLGAPSTPDSDWSDLGAPVQPRSVGRRYVENAGDALARSGVGQQSRRIDNGDGQFTAEDLLSVRVRKGGLIDRGLSALGVEVGTDDLTSSQQRERERRADFEARSQADPFYRAPGGVLGKAAAGAATLAGQLTGAALSPENWVAPGKTIAQRAAGNAAVGAGADVLLQGGDIGSGVQDEYSPLQTAGAGLAGATISIGADAAAAGARAAGRSAKRTAGRVADRLVPDQTLDAATSVDGVRPADIPSRVDWSDLGRAASPAKGVGESWADLGAAAAPLPRAQPNATARQSSQISQAMARSHIEAIAPGARITSGARTREHNKAVGGAPNSWHISGQAADFVPPKGMTLERFREELKARGLPITELLDEGDHFHWAWGRKGGAAHAEPAGEPPSGGTDGVPERPFSTIPDAEDGGFTVDFASDSAPTATRATVPVGAAPEVRTADLWRQSPDELQRLHEATSKSDFEKLVQAFGSEDEARAFDRLERRRHSSDPRLSDEAAAEFERRYGDLTPEQERLVYGIGEEDRAQPDDILDMLRHQADVAGYSTDALVSEVARAIRMRPNAEEILGVPTGRVSDLRAQKAYVSLTRAVQELQRRGYDTRQLPGRVVADLVSSGYGKHSDVAEVVGSFLTGLKGEGAEPAGVTKAPRGGVAQSSIPALPSPDRFSLKPELRSGGLRAAPRPGGVRIDPGASAYEGQTISQLAQRLRTGLGLTHRQGRVKGKAALGTYDPASAVVRTKAAQELDQLGHEATHALEFMNGPALSAALKSHAAELRPLAYPGANPKHIREEGFAEFGRWYLTNPDHARKLAPDFYEAFEAALKADNPRAAADMKAIQEGYQRFLASPSLKTAAASIAYTGRPGPLGRIKKALQERGLWGAAQDLADDAYTAFVDDLHPVAKAVRTLQEIYAANHGGKRLSLDAARNPYALARLSREAYAAGHVDLMDGVVPYRGTEPDGPSLSDALEAALGERALGKWSKQDLKEFDAYLIARRMVHEYDRYARGELEIPPDRNSRAYHEAVIRDAEAANPKWSGAAQMVYDWLGALWKKERDAGLITEESYLNGLNNHPDYVPLMRDMSDKSPMGASRPRGAMQFAGGVKQFTGSTRDVISPLSSMMRRAYELNAIIKRNDVMKTLDDMAQAAGPGAGAIIERLPAKEAEAINVDAIEALTKAAEAAGLSERDVTTLVQAADAALDGASQATIFRQRDLSPKKGEAVVFVWRDGKKSPLLLADGEFGQSMFTALTGMNRDLQSGVVDAIAAGTQVLRYGVTLSPEFMSRNFVRDQLATWINTDVGFVPLVGSVRGAINEIAQSPTARRYGVAGGMRGGPNVAATKKPFPKTDREAEAQLQHLRKKGYRVRRFASWRGLAELTDLSETSTRLGVFEAAYKQARKRGLDEHDAMLEAAFTSRDYLDFGRRGSRMLSAVRVVTFLNASLQSLDKTVRVLTAGGNLHKVLAPLGANAPRTAAERRALSHAYKAWAKVSALGMFGLALRMLYADDPEYEEISDQLRATHWVAKVGGRWVFIPKPFELATLSNILERAYEAGQLKDPTAPKRLLSDFSKTIAPPHEIPAVSVPFAVARNRDYQGRPIVPDHLRGAVDPEYQFNSYTSELGKFIGRVLSVSPAVVDYTITGFGGSLGRYALQGTNLAVEKATGRPSMKAGPEDYFLSRGFVRDVSRGSTSQKEFWDLVAKSEGDYTQAVGTFRLLMKEGDRTKAAEFLNSLPAPSRAYVQAEALGPGPLAKLHPIRRAQATVSLIGDLRRENRDGALMKLNGQTIALTPSQRREVDDALAHLAMTEMRNALIKTGVRGWAQKDAMRREDSLERLGAVSHDLPRLLDRRMALARVPSADVSEKDWDRRGERLDAKVDPQRLGRQITARRLKTSNRYERIRAAREPEGPPKRRVVNIFAQATER